MLDLETYYENCNIQFKFNHSKHCISAKTKTINHGMEMMMNKLFTLSFFSIKIFAQIEILLHLYQADE